MAKKKERKSSKHYKGWYKFLKIILYPIYLLLFRVKTIGRHNIPIEQKYILAGNHRSWKDVPVIAFNTEKYLKFVSKQEHMESVGIGWAISKIGALPVNREASDLKFMRSAIAALNKKEPLVIFPEGTRNNNEEQEMLQLKGGTALLARRTSSLIVPFIIYTKPQFLKRNYLYFGEPIDIFTDAKSTDKNSLDECAIKIKKSLHNARLELEDIIANKKVKHAIKLDKKLVKEKKKAYKIAVKNNENI